MDLKWPEMPSKVHFGHPKMADHSEMARNAIESEFRTSKMADGNHFVKKFQIDFRTSKMADEKNNFVSI